MVCLLVQNGPSAPFTHDLKGDSITIGRSPENSVALASDSVSTKHAHIRFTGGKWHLRDLQSSNGTTLNGLPVQEATLADGDLIVFGGVECQFLEKDTAERTSEVPQIPKARGRSMLPLALTAGLILLGGGWWVKHSTKSAAPTEQHAPEAAVGVASSAPILQTSAPLASAEQDVVLLYASKVLPKALKLAQVHLSQSLVTHGFTASVSTKKVKGPLSAAKAGDWAGVLSQTKTSKDVQGVNRLLEQLTIASEWKTPIIVKSSKVKLDNAQIVEGDGTLLGLDAITLPLQASDLIWVNGANELRVRSLPIRNGHGNEIALYPDGNGYIDSVPLGEVEVHYFTSIEYSPTDEAATERSTRKMIEQEIERLEAAVSGLQTKVSIGEITQQQAEAQARSEAEKFLAIVKGLTK